MWEHQRVLAPASIVAAETPGLLQQGGQGGAAGAAGRRCFTKDSAVSQRTTPVHQVAASGRLVRLPCSAFGAHLRSGTFGHLNAGTGLGGTAVRLVAQVMREPCVTRRPSFPRRGSPSFEYPQASSPPRDPSPIYLPWQGRAAAQFRRIFFLSHDAARFFPQRSASGS